MSIEFINHTSEILQGEKDKIYNHSYLIINFSRYLEQIIKIFIVDGVFYKPMAGLKRNVMGGILLEERKGRERRRGEGRRSSYLQPTKTPGHNFLLSRAKTRRDFLLLSPTTPGHNFFRPRRSSSSNSLLRFSPQTAKSDNEC